MLIRLCHTYNPPWAHMAKALLGAHGVEVKVVHEQAMHLYAPGSVMPCTLLVEEEDWADAVEILRAEPVEVDAAPVPPPVPVSALGKADDTVAADAPGPVEVKAEAEVESREHYFPDPMALLMSRALVGGALGVTAILFSLLRTEVHVRALNSLGHVAVAEDAAAAINLFLGHVISTPLVLVCVPVLIWIRSQHAASFRLGKLRKAAVELRDEEG